MEVGRKMPVRRRDFLHVFGAGAVAVAAAPLTTDAKADTENYDEKRKARYKANSAEVQTYYRVNRYPK
ncbi:MAG: formate dehydrogenase [Terriglobia bacterium]